MRRLPLPGHSTTPSRVGHFRVAIEIARLGTDRFTALQALVDTGSTYTWIPDHILAALGVQPEHEWPFELADGREVRYGVAWIQIRLEHRQHPTVVVFAPSDAEPMLGVVTLEESLLAVDPVHERLIAVPGLSKRVS